MKNKPKNKDLLKRKKERINRQLDSMSFTNRFIDDNGDEWTMRIHGGNMARLQTDCGFNVCKVVSAVQEDSEKTPQDAFTDLLLDIPRLIDVFYVICEPDCIERGVSEYEFASRMFGDTIYNAMRAFIGACINFSPDRNVRKILQRTFAVSMMAGDKLIATEAKNLDRLTESLAANL